MINKLVNQKKVVLFGTGGNARIFIEKSGIKVDYFVDNDSKKWGQAFYGSFIANPETLSSESPNELFIVVASMYFTEIATQLSEMGFKNNVHFFNCDWLLMSLEIAGNESTEKIIYPKVINYPITNKCNYRCAMCNVWKPEYSAKPDLTPEEIKRVLSQPLFKEVEHVGLSGGEPFVRKDIVEVVTSICDAVKSLKSLSIITNASMQWTLERAIQISELLQKRNVTFFVQVSVDGVGEVHGKNRGVEGAFQKTMANVYKLQEVGLLNEISTTITKHNCHSLWDVYHLARSNHIYIRFRLATMIDRLYNHDLVHNFTFTPMEKLKIIKFLENIIADYEPNRRKQFFYQSLIGQLQGEKRKAGCDYQTSKGVSLDPYGNLHFCFPSSGVIRNISNPEVNYDIDLLSDHIHVLDRALKSCDRCTHDYDGPMNAELVGEMYGALSKDFDNKLQNKITLDSELIDYDAISCEKAIEKVSILGWYGTETLGDKAILGGIIDNLLTDGIRLEDITLISLHPVYSQLTLLEMDLNAVHVADAYLVKNDELFIASQDLFIFGGGPLCDVDPLVDMLEIFTKAKKLRKNTMIYASGIGPLKEERNIKALNKLLYYTDRLCFRDELSLQKYSPVLPQLTAKQDIRAFIDPATHYIMNRICGIHSRIIQEEYVMFCFREWPYMYADGLTEEEYKIKTADFEKKMIELIRTVSRSGRTAVLFPMHNFHVGYDDREYFLTVLEKMDQRDKEHVTIIGHDYTPMEAINYFKYAKFAVCMRFHSVVFAVSCNTPFIALDYHYGKGKVSGFLNNVGLEQYGYEMDAFSQLDCETLLRQMETGHYHWDQVNSIIANKNSEMFKYMSIHNTD